MHSFIVAPSPLKSCATTVPGDKSISHRSLMFSAIAEGTSTINGLLLGEDCLATLRAIEAMGIEVERPTDSSFKVRGAGLRGLAAPRAPLDLGNSGTGMRLFCGLLAGQAFSSTLTGDASLSSRPMGRVIDPLRAMGAMIASEGGRPPLRIEGASALKGIDYSMPIASAQVKSALLLAGLYADGETVVTEPAVTRDHTERMLSAMGVKLSRSAGRVSVVGGQRLRAVDITVPSDLSSAAFFIVAALLAPDCELLIPNVGINPTRTGLLDILAGMGADIELENHSEMGNEPVADIYVRSSELQAVDVGAEQVSLAIDEFPILFVAAAAATGTSRFSGLAELRVKESDRIAAMAAGLQALGISVRESTDGAEIDGGQFQSGSVDSHGDHRIAMAFAVAGTVANGSVTVRDVAPVETSFPGFAEKLSRAGGRINLMSADDG